MQCEARKLISAVSMPKIRNLSLVKSLDLPSCCQEIPRQKEQGEWHHENTDESRLWYILQDSWPVLFKRAMLTTTTTTKSTQFFSHKIIKRCNNKMQCLNYILVWRRWRKNTYKRYGGISRGNLSIR